MELFASDSDLLSPLSPISTSTGDLTSIQEEEEEEEEQPIVMSGLPPVSPGNVCYGRGLVGVVTLIIH